MKPEAKFSHWLCENILTRGHVQRIENTAGSGVPDINYCTSGVDVWIETKVDSPLLRPFQWAWMVKRRVHRSRVFIFVEAGDAIHIWDMRQWHHVCMHGKYVCVSKSLSNIVNKSDPQLIDVIHKLLLN